MMHVTPAAGRSPRQRFFHKILLLGALFALSAFPARAHGTNPSVVMVLGYQPSTATHIQASGFFVNGRGDVATNDHILAGTADLHIRTATGKSYPVTAIRGRDRYGDLAILGTTAGGDDSPPVILAAVPASPGTPVSVTGHPLGHDQRTSAGMVAALFPMGGGDTLIQISAPIAAGSSGSPVFDRQGRVIGVTAFIIYFGPKAPPRNYAIPAIRLRRLIAALPRRPEAGRLSAR